MKFKIRNIPINAGVYMMKNLEGTIIYIGKAKNLKNRVSSYFTGAHNRKTMELVKNIYDIEFFICETEIEALILENNLIKEHKPKYNILLKDQKTYPYIKITKEKIPKISMTRKITDNSYYFGPFPNMNIKEILSNLIKVFQVRDCKIDVYKNNTRVCLKYHMNLCNGPCVYKSNEVMEKYSKNVSELLSFLSNKNDTILEKITKKMNEYSEKEEFEKAIIERERLKSLKKLLESQVIESNRDQDEDIFSFDIFSNIAFLCVLNVRNGKLISKEVKVFENIIEEDILDTLISMYYEDIIPPKKIILQEKYETKKELLYSWFLEKKNKKVNFLFPKRGRGYKLLSISNLNLLNEKDSYFNKKENIHKGLEKLKEVLNLKKFPKRIECFDISNIQGTNPVAAMSVAINGEITPREYRHFKIQIKNTPDDFAMMREVLTRRYSKLKDEEFPEVILIDGGKGQIGVAVEVITELGKNHLVDILSIAKREEEIFKDIEKIPYIFSRNDEALRILQRARDEAHRFGITHHRKLRSKRVITSSLDNIDGIGPKRKKKLLEKFGSAKAIFSADIEELKKYLPEKIAENVKNGV